MCRVVRLVAILEVVVFYFTATDFMSSFAYGQANFVNTPGSPNYVVKGRNASFVWTYHVVNRRTQFSLFSPLWFFKKGVYENETVEIGYDNSQVGWNFQTSQNCPSRLLHPTVRVSRKDQATLVIKNVTHTDSGVYGCSIRLRGKSPLESMSQLIVTETPTFTNLVPIVAVVENNTMNILCEARGPPTPNITWVNAADDILQSTTRTGSAELSLPGVKRALNGTKFECQASNNPNQDPVKSHTTLIVYYPAEFTLLPMNKTVTQGDPISLHCEVIGNPTASVLWTENSPALKPGFNIYGNGTLVIPNADKNDAGMYTCTAQNMYQNQKHKRTAHAFVTVQYQPTIFYNTSRHSVKIGQSVAMRCKADGYPKPTINWSKPSGSIGSPGEWYNMSSVNKSDAGTYTCTASNGIGKHAKADITVTVQYKPEIDTAASNTTGSSWDGKNITLRCKYSEANPKPTWIWTKPNKENISSSAVKSDDNWSEITITTGQESSDYGTYKCIAQNVAGSDQHKINVTQLHAPGQVNFTIINIEAVSATVIWSKPVYDGGSPVTGYKLEVEERKFKNISESEYTRTVTGLTKDTKCIVKLYAKNVVGYGTASTETFRTKKQGPPASPVITRYNYVGPSSVELTWSKPDENGGEITSYTIYNRALDSEWKQVGQMYGPPLTCTVKNLEPGTTYQFIVTATNRFGESVKDDSKAKSVEIPVVTTSASTLAPIDGSKDKRSEPPDPNQPIIIAGAVVAVVLILVTVIISVIILKKRNIFGKDKRKCARTENAAYHNDVHSDDSSGRQAAVIDLGDASATYAAVDTSKKTKNKPKEIATYAAVDKSKKKKKPGEIIYAELADFNTNYTPAENRPVKYLETDYADISQFQNQSEPEPTYANFPGRSKDYANVSDI